LSWIKPVLREIFGLFVDDVSFAVPILVWLLVVAVAVLPLGTSANWVEPLLFLGLAAVLMRRVLSRTAQTRRR